MSITDTLKAQLKTLETQRKVHEKPRFGKSGVPTASSIPGPGLHRSPISVQAIAGGVNDRSSLVGRPVTEENRAALGTSCWVPHWLHVEDFI